MQLPILVDASSRRSLQEQIVDQVRELILAGKLSSGSPLPASRSLARDLRISRNTVLGAYQRLGAEGFLEAREQIGTFVAPRVHAEGPRQPLPEPDRSIRPDRALLARRLKFESHGHRVLSPDGPLAYDFWIGQVDPRLFPVRAWRSLLMKMLRTPSEQLCRYGDPPGLPALRAAIAKYSGGAPRIACDPAPPRARAHAAPPSGGTGAGPAAAPATRRASPSRTASRRGSACSRSCWCGPERTSWWRIPGIAARAACSRATARTCAPCPSTR